MTKGNTIALRIFTVALAVVLLCLGLFQTAVPLSKDPEVTPSGSIKVGGTTIKSSQLQTTPSPTKDTKKLPRLTGMAHLLSMFKSMGVLYDAQTDGGKSNTWSSFNGDLGMVNERAIPATEEAPGMAMESPAAAPADTGAGYSSTNTQVSGVDEGDIVKTDGKYIYSADQNKISIIQANGPEMKRCSEIQFAELTRGDKYTPYLMEMYVCGNYLVTVSSVSENLSDAVPDGRIMPFILYPTRNFTAYTVYDITDREKPVMSRGFDVEGSPLSTRMVGNVLYFVTQKYNYMIPFENMGEGDILPVYRDSAVSEDLAIVPVTDISYFPNTNDSSYMFVGAFDVSSLEPAVMNSYLGAGSNIYMSQSSLYVTRTSWDGTNKTEIYRFAADGVNIHYTGSGKVDGTALNQYSMDEYDGVFRIATTDWNAGSYVTMLDSSLNMIGRTPALAKGESIQSVRFMGRMGYVVTYRQTDPLFAIDLSDPASPKVLGELKIPGFSQYLHPVGENLLVGFGRHTEELYVKKSDGTFQPTGGTRDAGQKISLFDISNPAQPKEIDVMLLGENTYSEAFNNPRAMMVDAGRSLFGFFQSSWGLKDGSSQQRNMAYIISVENNRLVQKTVLPAEYSHSGSYRLCYIGNTLYSVGASSVTAYDYYSFKQLSSLSK